MTPPAPTGFYLHPSSPLHDTGWGHPEHQGRLRALASTVGKDLLALHDRVVQRDVREAAEADLLRVHTREHIDRVRAAVSEAEGRGALVALDPDTRVSAASWDAAVGSAGALLTAADEIVKGLVRNAFVAARPPGHHATPDRAMGFCLFNSVAVAARWLQHEGHAERVLIVDWDVHHGNGTQDAFYEDPSVFFLSLHQWPHYPGTGAANETGRDAGVGTTMNVPLPPGTPREEYLRRFDEALERATESFSPDFVLVSSGFDVLAGDPLGGQLLEPGDLHRTTRRVLSLADEACSGRVAIVLEGGYDPKRTGTGAVAVIRSLAGVDFPGPPGPGDDPDRVAG